MQLCAKLRYPLLSQFWKDPEHRGRWEPTRGEHHKNQAARSRTAGQRYLRSTDLPIKPRIQIFKLINLCNLIGMQAWKHREFDAQGASSHCETHSDSTDDELTLDYDPRCSHPQRINKTKYKTELCKNFSEMGWCPYGEKCQYAHGYNDFSLKVSFQNKKAAYRTRKCKSFWNEGKCTYGKRCQFLHYEPQPIDKVCLSLHLYLLENSRTQGQSRLLSCLSSCQ